MPCTSPGLAQGYDEKEENIWELKIIVSFIVDI
jgi:hypothetical protein